MGFFRRIIDRFRGRRGRDVGVLAEWLGMQEGEIQPWQKGLPSRYRYQTFKIRKKRGGWRTIEAPNDQLKGLQRLVYQKLLKELPLHEAATGFVAGKSIVDNARPHVGQEVVINIDLKDFFPTIKAHQVMLFWQAIGWSEPAAHILTNICCYRGHLPQGAPTSPALSNAVNRRLDKRLAGLAAKLKGEYTRYADDLTFSFPKFGWRQRNVVPMVKKILQEEGYAIQKKKKIRIQRPHQRQTVTGLLVNEKINLPRKTRRKIRAMQHQRDLGRLSGRGKAELAGYEALLSMVEEG
ncbi:MAG TPA: retron St85 family RNA-directed DNA polymerase [Anaerolineae bacterium]|nr:retron St85 family RNA-directed DNA polymerase [Anaerolineae bacterium]